MSSGSIYGQIIECQNRIEEVKAEIKRLETLVAKQGEAIRQYVAQKQKYQDKLQTQEKIFATIASHKTVSVFAEKYVENLSEYINNASQSNMYDKVDNIESLMKMECNKTQNELEETRRELTGLQNRLTQLHIEHGNAVRAEQEEAAAAVETAGRK